jgi:hypothetical protein
MKPKQPLILDKEFIDYCKLNNITDIEKTAKDVFNRGFTILKFGEIPTGNKTIERIEVPVEKIVYVDKVIEKIIEIEKIVEVPVEIIKQGETITKEIIKEVINNEEIDRLQKENLELKTELNNITTALTNASKTKVMRNSDMTNLYDE